MYKYRDERHTVFTDDGVEMLVQIREQAEKLFDIAGCATIENLIRPCLGDSFTMLACIDFLVEKGHIEKVHQNDISTQRQIYKRRVSF